MEQQVFQVITPGPLTTVQDGGRPAARRYGVPEGGAMDPFALRAANALVGNQPLAPALEATLGGLQLEALATCVVAVTGAELDLLRDDVPLPLWTACLLRRGEHLRLGQRRGGGRAYVAVAGGVAVEPVLGGAGTELGGAFGGVGGRALRAHDVLHSGQGSEGRAIPGLFLPPERRPAYTSAPQLRVIAGPHTRAFPPAVRQALITAEFRVGVQSNRMGYRLSGPLLAARAGTVVPSLGVVAGAIQGPPGGEPILLMADAQTTGGYPIIAAVISADLPLAAQLLPGDAVRFARVTLREAHTALAQQRALLALPLDEEFGAAPI